MNFAKAKRRKRFPTDWLIRLFNATGQQIETFEVHGKYSWEVATLVESRKGFYDDWAMTPTH